MNISRPHLFIWPIPRAPPDVVVRMRIKSTNTVFLSAINDNWSSVKAELGLLWKESEHIQVSQGHVLAAALTIASDT